ncbi:MAG: hypothetical protein VX976_02670 [Pseudomonadota bacterium]|nr:hypothetical protein [Pseudomonadota bacterium]
MSFSIQAEEILECSTTKHIGLNFLGKDYNHILDHLKLRNFEIKLSRSRDDVYKNEIQKKDANKAYIPKTSHFIEIVIIKSSGYPIPMHCSWLFDIRYNNKNEKNFNCMGVPENDKVFSLDFKGNFMYSSSFNEFVENKSIAKERKTLHSLIGNCKKKI